MVLTYDKFRRYILALACLTRWEYDHSGLYVEYDVQRVQRERYLYLVRSKIHYISLVLKEAIT